MRQYIESTEQSAYHMGSPLLDGSYTEGATVLPFGRLALDTENESECVCVGGVVGWGDR